MNEPAAIPDLTLERYRLHELPADETARVERLLDTDAGLRQRLTALVVSDTDIRDVFPPALMARGIAGRMTGHGANRSPAITVLRWAAPTAAVFLIAFVAVRSMAVAPPDSSSALSADDGNRIKGLAATLAIYRRTDAGSELLADGDRAHSGDLLRIGYKVANPGFGVILSVDGRGLVTLHLPADGGRAVALNDGDTVLLDRAYELDDAPKWERFYFVTARTSFDVEPVLSALRAASPTHDTPAPLALAPDLEQVTFVLQKDTRP